MEATVTLTPTEVVAGRGQVRIPTAAMVTATSTGGEEIASPTEAMVMLILMGEEMMSSPTVAKVTPTRTGDERMSSPKLDPATHTDSNPRRRRIHTEVMIGDDEKVLMNIRLCMKRVALPSSSPSGSACVMCTFLLSVTAYCLYLRGVHRQPRSCSFWFDLVSILSKQISYARYLATIVSSGKVREDSLEK